MGSKIAARRLAQAAGVPVVPGETPADQSDAAIVAAATRIGFPLLLKPSEGGGGIGMKAVRDAASLAGAIAQARREAMAAFGDGTLYVERLVEKPRHVEFQILADHHGDVVHLFERECSIQRRHQKVIEETPSTALTRVAAAADGRRRGGRRARGGISECRHGGVSARWDRRLRAVLFPRDEHAPAGRASGHRAGHRHRPRARADRDRVGTAAAVDAGRARPTRSRHRGPRVRRGSGAERSAAGRPAAPLSRAVDARHPRRCGRHRKAPRSACTTTRCSPS